MNFISTYVDVYELVKGLKIEILERAFLFVHIKKVLIKRT